jgi:hypothetical protein
VDVDGVFFTPRDILALLIAAYANSADYYVGPRCSDGAGIERIERDGMGRAVNDRCGDLEADDWHLTLGNYLGLAEQAVGFDIRVGDIPHSYPIAEYELTTFDEIGVDRAASVIAATGNEFHPHPRADKIFEVLCHFVYLWPAEFETPLNDPLDHEVFFEFTYLLETDAQGEILEGHWTGDSAVNHPTFLWTATPPHASSMPHLALHDVRDLLEESRTVEVTDRDQVYRGGGVTLPDAGDAQTVTIEVSESFTVDAVAVELDIDHPYVGDLFITLHHAGVSQNVWNLEGASADGSRIALPVPGFVGVDAAGRWDLEISDEVSGDAGSLDGWTLRLRPELDE